jgi:hypothetical protein
MPAFSVVVRSRPRQTASVVPPWRGTIMASATMGPATRAVATSATCPPARHGLDGLSTKEVTDTQESKATGDQEEQGGEAHDAEGARRRRAKRLPTTLAVKASTQEHHPAPCSPAGLRDELD